MTILKLYSEIPVAFPINLEMTLRGNTYRHRFNEGDIVKCIWCDSEIELGEDTVFKYRHPIDVNPRVSCKYCGNVADIAYYANHKNLVKVRTWDAEHVKTEFDPVEQFI
jgi:DNA-directed RNA polymerase subunit RPC12/RpoP